MYVKSLKRFCSNVDPLKETLERIIPLKIEEMKNFRESKKDFIIGNINVDQLYSGMRGLRTLTYETSLLDSEVGIRFRGYSVPEIKEKLPKLNNSNEPLPESIFWLLLTGEIPTLNETLWLSKELAKRSKIPKEIFDLIDKIPKNVHPMAQLSSIMTLLSSTSIFSKEYNSGLLKKNDFWKPIYQDSLNLIAQVSVISAKIYRNIYHDGKMNTIDLNKDYSYNFANMLGSNDNKFVDFIRLYLTIHTDHEGGNVSAHANKLVATALSDPFLSFGACLNGLAGPLHGRANQEVVEWLDLLISKIGIDANNEQITKYCNDFLKKGVIPGYGHAVLRMTDPRFTVQMDFANKQNISSSKQLKLVQNLYNIVPNILNKLGKVKNPNPNVDAISGSLLKHFGIIEKDFYTVPFGVSRAMGVTAATIWDRIFNLPLERPNSITTPAFIKMVENLEKKKMN